MSAVRALKSAATPPESYSRGSWRACALFHLRLAYFRRRSEEMYGPRKSPRKADPYLPEITIKGTM
jgi:hypothetical protein